VLSDCVVWQRREKKIMASENHMKWQSMCDENNEEETKRKKVYKKEEDIVLICCGG
jgi:predicted ribonuclease toxin of YeeF-YezG toxin-antitoxin module